MGMYYYGMKLLLTPIWAFSIHILGVQKAFYDGVTSDLSAVWIPIFRLRLHRVFLLREQRQPVARGQSQFQLPPQNETKNKL